MTRERRRGDGQDVSGEHEALGETLLAEAKRALDEVDRALESYVREEATQLAHGEALRNIADLDQASETIDKRLAWDRYLIGEKIAEFLAYKGHRALGYTLAGDCVRERFKRGRTWAAESARLSRVTTRDVVKDMTWTVAKAGLDLLPLMNATDFEALSKKPLPLATEDGEPMFFPDASVEQLHAAITLLRKQKKADAQPKDEAGVKAAERAAVRKAKGILMQHLEKAPALKSLKPKVYIHKGAAHFRCGSVEIRSPLFDAYLDLVTEIRRVIPR